MMQTNKVHFSWFKFSPEDWLEGTRDLTPEQRGLYIDFIAMTMKNERPLSDDDNRISHGMCVSKRLWKSVKTKLIDSGKIVLSDGRLVNQRCLMELRALTEERKRRSNAALTREQNKRGPALTGGLFAPVSGSVQARVTPEPDANQPRTSRENKKISNEINAEKAQDYPQRATIIDIDIEKKKNKRANALSSENPTERESASSSQGYYANGVAIYGQGWILPYAEVDRVAAEIKFDLAEAHKQAIVAAEHWTVNKIAVEDPVQRFSEGLKKLQARPRDVAKLAFEEYNKSAADSGFPKAIKLTKARATKIAARISEIGGMDQFREALEKASKSSHCRGGSNSGWRLDFDFLCQPGSMLKILEGRYDNRKPGVCGLSPPERKRTPAEEARRAKLVEMFGIEGAV